VGNTVAFTVYMIQIGTNIFRCLRAA